MLNNQIQFRHMSALKVTLFLFSFTFFNLLSAQNVELEGYVYETGNRGFLNLVSIKIYDTSNRLVTSTASDMSGTFKVDLPLEQDFIITASKDIFKERKMALSTKGKVDGEQLYLKVEMNREPGYIFDVTLAAKRSKQQIKAKLPSDAIMGARIEVYNNTKEKQIIDIKDNPFPNFKVHFTDGNHYTIMVRKKGFFTKRMEAYVNVEGCILCFDGVGEVKPGVSDVMTEENKMGTLLANVEMQPVEVGKSIKVEKIYYNKNSAKIRKDAAEELDKLITVLKDNPALIIELGSHTDSRGDTKFNRKLSQRRAEAAVKYLTNDTGIESYRITAKGYGESKLVNSCKDGVECSEARHQKNRRTEIKVTGVLAEDPLNKLSLKQIIDKENVDKLLEEILNQEIVEVKAGEELPEEIKNQMEGKTNVDTKPVAKVEEEPEQEIIEQVEVVSVKPGEKRRKADPVKSEPIVKESELAVSNTIKEEPVAQSKEPVVRKPTKREYVAPKINRTSQEGRKILNDLEVDVEYVPASAKKLETNYTGYMVEFFNAQSELPLSHEIFTRHGKIYEEVKKDGTYAYLFGPFGEWRDANRFLQSAVSENYQDSKVIRYKNGRRVQKN